MAHRLRKILITAGPTREKIDSVRFISNLSTGEMGYAIARAASRRKYRVTLVSGPTGLKPPKGVRFVSIVDAKELERACRELFPKNDCLIMSAAVCDFTPENPRWHKLPSGKGLKLRLKRTPDIIKSMAKRKGSRLVIGFCLETRDLIAKAKEKLVRKNLDGIVANYYSKTHSPFGNRSVKMALIDSNLEIRLVGKQPKSRIADVLLDWVEKICEESRANKNLI